MQWPCPCCLIWIIISHVSAILVLINGNLIWETFQCKISCTILYLGGVCHLTLYKYNTWCSSSDIPHVEVNKDCGGQYFHVRFASLGLINKCFKTRGVGIIGPRCSYGLKRNWWYNCNPIMDFNRNWTYIYWASCDIYRSSLNWSCDLQSRSHCIAAHL